MKNRRRKATPEESLRASCEEGMGVELDYTRVRERLDVEAITRAGAGRKAASSPAPIPAVPPRRSAIPAVCLVLAVLILTPALAVGGFLIARMTMGDEPPVEETPTDTNGNILLPPMGDPENESNILIPPLETLPEETTEANADELLPPGEIVSPHVLGAEALEALRDALFDLSSSYATQNDLYDSNSSLDAERHTLFLRMNHLPAEIADAEQPTMLWVEDHDLWRSLFPSLSSHTNESYSVLDTALCGYNSRFFDSHSLLILFTEGRSGSIRYRLEDTSANREYVMATLTAGVPAANTMDIAYWCVMVPVAKPKGGETNRPVYLKTHEVAMDSFENFASPSPEVYRGLWFYGYSDGSYERDGYLYGRMANALEIRQTWTYPKTEIFTSYEDWQTRYGGCYTKYMRKTFYEGLCAINEDFFAQKSLLVVYLEEGSGSIHHRVDGVTTEDGVLNVKVTSLNAGGSDDMGQWAILIPIDKKLDSLPVELELGEQLCTWEEYEALPELQDWDVLEE